MSRRSSGRLITEIFVTFSAILGSLCLLAAVAAIAWGATPVVFRSGSMSPAIDTGDLAVSRTVPAAELTSGDIVTVKNAQGVHITHRIVASQPAGTQRQLTLRGDANTRADVETYTVSSAARVIFTVPKAGYAVGFASSPLGQFFLGLYVALLVMLIVRSSSGHDDQLDGQGKNDGRRKSKMRARTTRGRRVLIRRAWIVPTALVLTAAPASAAPWTDSASTAGLAYSAHTVARPDQVICTGGGLLGSLTFTWPNKDLRYEYVITLEDGAGVVKQSEVIANSGSLTTALSKTYGFTLLNGIFGLPAGVTVRVRSRLTSTSAWTSSTTAVATGKLLSLGIIGLGSSCD